MISLRLVERSPVNINTLIVHERQVGQYGFTFPILALQRMNDQALFAHITKTLGNRVEQCRVRPQLKEKIRSLIGKPLDCRRKKHGFTDIAPPILPVEFLAVE